jgi:nicotinamide-nucleotide amidase
MKQRILKLYGLDEPSIAEILKELKGKTGDIILGFYPHFPENHITISLWGKNDPGFTKELGRVEKEIKNLIGPYIFATDNQTMEEVVGQMLIRRTDWA